MKHFIRTALTAGAMAVTATVAMAADYKLDISLDTGPSHIRNESIMQFADELTARSEGRLEVRVFHAASQFKGSNVPTALAQGALDMGAPLHQHFSKIIPEAGTVLLPLFYGASPDEIHTVWDGPAGDALNAMIEKKLRVKVIGRWFDLGYGTVFTTEKQLNVPEDMEGMKMRVPGGAANMQRYSTFGSNPVSIPFSDVPQALQRGTVDGIWSTQESVRSAKLWESGISYAFEDRQAYLQYVPMVSMAAWNKYPEDIQNLITDTWEDMIDDVRAVAMERQLKARDIAAENGVVTVDPAAADLARMRDKLLAGQAQVAEELGIDAGFVSMVEAELVKLR